ncbi:uncharacterized protein LOC129601228, partial [Paramacrobiotus metropolitanus]|uniref:uncharacterized protein LOC129601228 n=1 Tax=Paramacrobiotus metropolitanus TaxID=2943436 RepID=UPI002445A8BF
MGRKCISTKRVFSQCTQCKRRVRGSMFTHFESKCELFRVACKKARVDKNTKEHFVEGLSLLRQLTYPGAVVTNLQDTVTDAIAGLNNIPTAKVLYCHKYNIARDNFWVNDWDLPSLAHSFGLSTDKEVVSLLLDSPVCVIPLKTTQPQTHKEYGHLSVLIVINRGDATYFCHFCSNGTRLSINPDWTNVCYTAILNLIERVRRYTTSVVDLQLYEKWRAGWALDRAILCSLHSLNLQMGHNMLKGSCSVFTRWYIHEFHKM